MNNNRPKPIWAAVALLLGAALSIVFSYFPDWLVTAIIIAMCLTGVLGVLLAIYANKRYLIQMRGMRTDRTFGEWSTIGRYHAVDQAVTVFKTLHEAYIIPGFVEYRIFDKVTETPVDISGAFPTVVVGWGWNHGKRSWLLPKE